MRSTWQFFPFYPYLRWSMSPRKKTAKNWSNCDWIRVEFLPLQINCPLKTKSGPILDASDMLVLHILTLHEMKTFHLRTKTEVNWSNCDSNTVLQQLSSPFMDGNLTRSNSAWWTASYVNWPRKIEVWSVCKSVWVAISMPQCYSFYTPRKGMKTFHPGKMGRCKLIKLCLDLCFELVENLTMDRKGKTPSFDAFKMAILNILMYMWVQTDQTEKMDRGKLNTKCEIGATFEIILGGNFNAVTAFHPGKMDRCKLIKACLDHCLTKFYNPIMDRKTQFQEFWQSK